MRTTLHITQNPDAAHLHEWAHAIYRFLQTNNPRDLPQGVTTDSDTSTRHLRHVRAQHGDTFT